MKDDYDSMRSPEHAPWEPFLNKDYESPDAWTETELDWLEELDKETRELMKQEHERLLKAYPELADTSITSLDRKSQPSPTVRRRGRSKEAARTPREFRRHEFKRRETLDTLNARYYLESLDVPELNWEALPDNLFWIEARSHFNKEPLPIGYGYKGGSARALLRRALGINPEEVPRDVDVVRFSDEEPEPGMDQRMAETYMPEDFKHGDGVEEITDIKKHLATRDLTINEVVAVGDDIFATEACVRDTIRGIIRVTDYERKSWGGIGPKMQAKAMRFYTQAIVQEHRLLAFDPDLERYLNHGSLSEFWVALNLERAYETGHDVAEEFVHTLRRRGQIPENIYTPSDLIKHLDKRMDKPFFYQNVPNSVHDMERRAVELGIENGDVERTEDTDAWMEDFDDYPLQTSMRRSA